jgi:hypothetical protein
MQRRSNVLLAAFCILVAAVQLVATRWGLAGALIGGFLSGVLTLSGTRVLALETENLFLLPFVAAAASLLGLCFGIAGSGRTYPVATWAAPLFAALSPGVLALSIRLRGSSCQICHARLRRLLFFSCPRCHLVACENCWQFERGRCRLCDANQIPLFPLEFSWWQEHFGSQVLGERCALCLRAADGRIAHWACGSCGHSQCRSCWDDNNGQCSRCAWTIPDLPAEVSEYIAVGTRPGKINT